MSYQVIILAGGLGTRLRKEIGNIPKPMANINGKPFLQHLLTFFLQQHIDEVILSVGYGHDAIKSYFGNYFGSISLIYSIEDEPLGTGGAIKKALSFVNGEDVLIQNGDTIFKINLCEFCNLHRKNRSYLSVALKFAQETNRFGAIEINDMNEIISFHEKQNDIKGFINAGIYLLKKEFLCSLNLPNKFSFEHDFLEKYYKHYKFFGFPFNSYFIDIGVPEDYKRAQDEFKTFQSQS